MCREGQSAPQDYAPAARWYLRSADQGNVRAQHDLGIAYYLGDGVRTDYVQALKWLNLAVVIANDPDFRLKVAGNINLLTSKMTPAQRAEAQRLASEWRKT